MSVPLLLLFLPILASAYNLDVENVMVYTASSVDDRMVRDTYSFFGYSVLLHSKMKKTPSVHESWMVVGAPKANYTIQDSMKKILQKSGVAYTCQLPGNCTPIAVTDPEDQDTIVNNDLGGLIVKEHSWFGGAMSLSGNDDLLTVCAPRTILKIYNHNGSIFDSTMQGACYNGTLTSGTVSIEDKLFSTYSFNSDHWVNPLNGFAVHYPRLKRPVGVQLPRDSSDSLVKPVQPVVGSPVHKLAGTLHKMGQSEYAVLSNNSVTDYLSLFGYAISSGYYFDKLRLMVAGGAPEWKYVGRVAIMDYKNLSAQLPDVPMITGTEIGEFFGGSLATGDMNNDGLDDLIVGAPHWKNDNGRVYIFLGNKDGFFEAEILLEGSVDDALYGYAITSGDLDSDGFDDLIVAAPWEESGTIYVYNGDAEPRELSFKKFSQRITASDIGSDIRSFGFSLSNVLDIDGNGYSDVAVGAYASGHAVVLRSRPIVKTTITLTATWSLLLQDSTYFVLKYCLNNNRIDKNNISDDVINVMVYEEDKRVPAISFQEKISKLPEFCANKTIRLQVDNFVRNKICKYNS